MQVHVFDIQISIYLAPWIMMHLFFMGEALSEFSFGKASSARLRLGTV